MEKEDHHWKPAWLRQGPPKDLKYQKENRKRADHLQKKIVYRRNSTSVQSQNKGGGENPDGSSKRPREIH